MQTQELEQLSLAMARTAISSPYRINVQTLVTNRRRRIGSVICKLNNGDKFTTKETIDATRSIWHCKGDATPLENRKFIFSFDSERDRDNTLRKQPWVILGQVLVLHLVTEDNFMLDPPLTDVPFWVIFDGLPLDYHS